MGAGQRHSLVEAAKLVADGQQGNEQDQAQIKADPAQGRPVDVMIENSDHVGRSAAAWIQLLGRVPFPGPCRRKGRQFKGRTWLTNNGSTLWRRHVGGGRVMRQAPKTGGIPWRWADKALVHWRSLSKDSGQRGRVFGMARINVQSCTESIAKPGFQPLAAEAGW